MAVNLGGSIALAGQLEIRDYIAPPATDVKLDDTWWTSPNGFMVWSGAQQRWNYTFFGGGTTGLDVITSGINLGWEVGYTPVSVDLTFFSGTFSNPYDFFVLVTDDQVQFGGNTIGTTVTSFTDQNTVYVVNVPLNFSGTGDIGSIEFGYQFGGASDEVWYCSNIVFNL